MKDLKDLLGIGDVIQNDNGYERIYNEKQVISIIEQFGEAIKSHNKLRIAEFVDHQINEAKKVLQ